MPRGVRGVGWSGARETFTGPRGGYDGKGHFGPYSRSLRAQKMDILQIVVFFCVFGPRAALTDVPFCHFGPYPRTLRVQKCGHLGNLRVFLCFWTVGGPY